MREAGVSSVSRLTILHRGNTHVLLKEFPKSRLVGKMKYIRHLLDSRLRGFQKDFSFDDQGVIDPLMHRK